MVGNQSIPWARAHCHTYFGVKKFSSSEVAFCGVSWQWVRYSVKSTNGGFGRSIVGRKGKIRVSYWIFQWEQSPVPSYVNNLPPGGRLISKLGTQCWLLLSAGWAPRSGCSQTGVGEWESITKPMHDLHPSHQGHIFSWVHYSDYTYFVFGN